MRPLPREKDEVMVKEHRATVSPSLLGEGNGLDIGSGKGGWQGGTSARWKERDGDGGTTEGNRGRESLNFGRGKGQDGKGGDTGRRAPEGRREMGRRETRGGTVSQGGDDRKGGEADWFQEEKGREGGPEEGGTCLKASYSKKFLT